MTTEQKKFNYLEINRGRYLCPAHGGFCDSSDNYLNKCPLCQFKNEAEPCQINKVDRLLQVINGLQNRSKRNVALLASLIGGIGALRLAAEIGGGFSDFAASAYAKLFAYLAVVVLLISLALYGASMAHIRTTNTAAIMNKSLSEWESYLAGKLGRMECWHIWAGRLLELGRFC